MQDLALQGTVRCAAWAARGCPSMLQNDEEGLLRRLPSKVCPLRQFGPNRPAITEDNGEPTPIESKTTSITRTVDFALAGFHHV